jgi:ArsR family transcriptional regulator
MKPATLSPDDTRLLGLFKALANPVRFRMVRYMVDHPQCITGELAEFADLAQSTTSQHLAVLREAGLVRGTLEGPATCYCLDPATLAWFREHVDRLAEQLAADCCPPADGIGLPAAAGAGTASDAAAGGETAAGGTAGDASAAAAQRPRTRA